MSRLRRRGGYLAAARNALIGRQRRAALDLPDEQIEGTLCVRLYQFELRENVLESFDMVSVLHLVEAIRWALLVVSTRLTAILAFRDGCDLARVSARVMIDWQ